MNNSSPKLPVVAYELVFIQNLSFFSDDERDSLWKQGVDLDDVDFIIIGSPELVALDMEAEHPDGEVKYVCTNDMIHKLASRNWSYDADWHLVNFRGKSIALCVSNH